MNKRTNVFLAVVVVSVLLLGLALSCGGGGGGTTQQQPTAAPQKPAAQAPAPATAAPAPAKPGATAVPSKPAAPSAPAAQPTAAAAKPAPAGADKKAGVAMPQFLRLKGTASPGSILDIIAKGMIYNIEEAFPDVRTRNIPGGTYEGVWRVESGEVDAGVTNTSEPYAGWYGMAPYPKATRSIRTLFQMPYISTTMFVVRDDSKITGIKDFAGKKINVGIAGYTFARTIAPALLKLYGLSYDALGSQGGSVMYTTFDVGLQMLADGKLDVACSAGVDPYGPLSAMAQTQKLRILQFTPKEVEETMRAAPGWVGSTLPAKVYKGQDEPVMVVGYGNPVLVSAGMPNDVAYNLAWAVFRDDGKRFKEMHPRFVSEDLVKTAADKLIVPLHPGAEAYWKARGLTIGQPMVETLGPPK